MCGIFGVVCRPGRFGAGELERAVGSLSHRGPDDRGLVRVEAGPPWEAWLGHARLSILDLTSAGHQPMAREGGAVAFNGEVYDHAALRGELRSLWEFRSRSDTEVLLAGVLTEGPRFVARANAQLAAAVHDARARTLVLARDRLGKKPLYVYRAGEVLAFASELKAFAALGLPLTEDREALAYFRWLGAIPGELTIWKECRKLPAASIARLDLRNDALPELHPEPYWDPFAGAARTFSGRYEDAIDQTLALLDDATKLRLDADVPVGIFLSGGIDSGLVASSVARQHGTKVTAFVVKTRSRDESEAAASVARRLGLELSILEPDPGLYARQLERAASHYDEPLAASSRIAVMGNAELARRSVAVVLTGDGGDETFLGYPWAARPAQIRRAMKALGAVGLDRPLVRALRTEAGRRLFVGALGAAGLGTATADNKLDLLEAAGARDAASLYEFFCAATPRSLLSAEDRQILGDEDLLARARRWYPSYGWEALAERSVEELLGGLDLVTYLRDDVLVKVDRGTMAYALEARSPFLDYRLVEHGMSLPRAFKIRGGVHKRILRDAFARRIGPENARLPKSGFSADEPAGLPAAPTSAMRWVLATEEAWRARWDGPAAAQPS